MDTHFHSHFHSHICTHFTIYTYSPTLIISLNAQTPTSKLTHTRLRFDFSHIKRQWDEIKTFYVTFRDHLNPHFMLRQRGLKNSDPEAIKCSEMGFAMRWHQILHFYSRQKDIYLTAGLFLSNFLKNWGRKSPFLSRMKPTPTTPTKKRRFGVRRSSQVKFGS